MSMTVSSKLHRLAALGQSVWLDSLSREMLDSGELAAYLERSVTGVTSNPTIFAKAVRSGNAYDAQVGEMVTRGAHIDEIYTAVVTSDIKRACDVLGPVHQSTGGLDGFVSVEVSPELAHDPASTVAEARDWVKRVNRPNLLIKVPATVEGIDAIEDLTAEGVSVNVTLIFSVERYQSVMDAYLGGLERFEKSGGDLGAVNSVASFFVSRFDTEVDARLEDVGSRAALALRGRTAVANARVAYLEFLRTFSGERWYRLRRAGANVQRPLWASTSTKNPTYSDTLYIDTLVAPQTVNTLPESALSAYEEGGPETQSVLGVNDLNDAVMVLEEVASVAAELERQGVAGFVSSVRQMIGDIESKRDAIYASGSAEPDKN